MDRCIIRQLYALTQKPSHNILFSKNITNVSLTMVKIEPKNSFITSLTYGDTDKYLIYTIECSVMASDLQQSTISILIKLIGFHEFELGHVDSDAKAINEIQKHYYF